MRIVAGGTLLWQNDDATVPGTRESFATTMGRTGVTRVGPGVLVQWQQRVDGGAVDISISSGGGAPLLARVATDW